MASVTSVRPVRRRRGKPGEKLSRSILWNAVGLLSFVLIAFPVYWMIVTALEPANEIQSYSPHFWPAGLTFSNFPEAFHTFNFTDDLINSLVITITAVLVSLLIGFFAAMAIARFRFFGKRAFIFVILLVQMVPVIALLIPMFLLMNQTYNLTNTLQGVILAYLVFTIPYTVWTLRGFIANIPRELDEAAMVDGCSRIQTFYKIILPLTLPGLVATAIYGCILAWNEFIIITTLNNDDTKGNLMVWLNQNTTSHGTAWGPLMAGAILTSIPVVILFLAIQKHITTGLTAGAVKG